MVSDNYISPTPGKIEVHDDGHSDHITLKYDAGQPQVFFDICDEGGRVIHTGNIDSGIATIEKDKIGQGYFTVIVVDGGGMCQKRFRVS